MRRVIPLAVLIVMLGGSVLTIEAQQDPGDLDLLGVGKFLDPVVDRDHVGRLDEEGLPAARGVVDDTGDLTALAGLHGEDVAARHPLGGEVPQPLLRRPHDVV